MKVRCGEASTVKLTFCPSSTVPTSASDTLASICILERSLAIWNSTGAFMLAATVWPTSTLREMTDRKSTRLNSSHLGISYAVFCLKKKSIGRALAWYDSLVYGYFAVTISHLFFPTVDQTLSFFFNDTATTEIYTLSLHDALPI